MTTLNIFRIIEIVYALYCSLSSILCSNPEIVGGNSNLKKDPREKNLVNFSNPTACFTYHQV